MPTLGGRGGSTWQFGSCEALGGPRRSSVCQTHAVSHCAHQQQMWCRTAPPLRPTKMTESLLGLVFSCLTACFCLGLTKAALRGPEVGVSGRITQERVYAGAATVYFILWLWKTQHWVEDQGPRRWPRGHRLQRVFSSRQGQRLADYYASPLF